MTRQHTLKVTLTDGELARLDELMKMRPNGSQ